MKVDIDALTSELEMRFDELYMYLDLETGEVIMISEEEKSIAALSEEGDEFSSYSEWEKDAINIALKIYQNNDRYLLLPKLTESEEYELMAEFCAAVKSAQIREQLLLSIKGKGAFKRFKDTILHFHIELDWYVYKSEQIKALAIKWCDENDVSYE